MVLRPAAERGSGSGTRSFEVVRGAPGPSGKSRAQKCDGISGNQDQCRLRGGSFNLNSDYLRCSFGDGYDSRKGSGLFVTGLRCCGQS